MGRPRTFGERCRCVAFFHVTQSLEVPSVSCMQLGAGYIHTYMRRWRLPSLCAHHYAPTIMRDGPSDWLPCCGRPLPPASCSPRNFLAADPLSKLQLSTALGPWDPVSSCPIEAVVAHGQEPHQCRAPSSSSTSRRYGPGLHALSLPHTISAISGICSSSLRHKNTLPDGQALIARADA